MAKFYDKNANVTYVTDEANNVIGIETGDTTGSATEVNCRRHGQHMNVIDAPDNTNKKRGAALGIGILAGIGAWFLYGRGKKKGEALHEDDYDNGYSTGWSDAYEAYHTEEDDDVEEDEE